MSRIKTITGDCRDVLPGLPKRSVHAVVTSPPYWNLRDYTKGDRREIGQEPDWDAYVDNIASVFSRVREVLRDDGTLWLNLGDTMQTPHLLGLPWRVAFAMQEDGWVLRSAIPWIKRNPKPESVTNRPTNALETVFLFSKRESYFYDPEPNRMPGSVDSIARLLRGHSDEHKHRAAVVPGKHADNLNKPRPNLNKTRGHARQENGWLDETKLEQQLKAGGSRLQRNTDWFWKSFQGLVQDEDGNPLAVVANTANYHGNHTATFPSRMIKPMILASTSEAGCCPECLSPFKRIIELGDENKEHQRACGGDVNGGYDGQATKDYDAAKAENPSAIKARILANLRDRKTIGWEPTCVCSNGRTFSPEDGYLKTLKRSLVLDPFGGSGTTGQVALELGRDAMLIELHPENTDQIQERTNITPGLL